MDTDKKGILVRSFMSIRTYAVLAVFAVVLMILLFSAGCSGAAAKSSLGDTRICFDGRTANQDESKHEIRIGI